MMIGEEELEYSYMKDDDCYRIDEIDVYSKLVHHQYQYTENSVRLEDMFLPK